MERINNILPGYYSLYLSQINYNIIVFEKIDSNYCILFYNLYALEMFYLFLSLL